MIQSQALSSFFSAIHNDPRISITHIGIYAALLQYWMEHQFANPIQVYSYQIMPLAKISASNTYHKAIRQLNEYGYIKYQPSFKRNQASKVFILLDSKAEISEAS